jgi:hypothetical protein
VRNCTTHHHACDCREAATRKIVNDLLHAAVVGLPPEPFNALHAEALRLGYVQGQADNKPCDVCGGAGAIPTEVWDAGGQRTCDYHEWKETRALCETCSDRWTVCEGCDALIGDNVWITGRNILCPDCQAKGQADRPASAAPAEQGGAK